MNRRALVLVVLAACPRGGGDPTTPPQGSAGSAAPRLLPDEGSALAVPPAPPVPTPPLGLPALPPPPFEDTTTDPNALALGELLFWDTRLSTTGKIACATCHDPARGFSGPKVPALVNLTWKRTFGSAREPIDRFLFAHVKAEFGRELYAAVAPISELPTYRVYFERVDPHNREHAALHGLAGFSLTRYSAGSPWDRMEETARVPKKGAASDPIVAGYALFAGRAGCAHCHPPPLYTDLDVHDAIATPTVRGAGAHAAFFHDARTATLDAAVAAPHGGAKAIASPDDARALAAFVRALTPDAPPPAKPVLP